jgi:small GTP-binding protein
MKTLSTVCGGDRYVRSFQLSDGTFINCMILDTAGQERFDSLNLTYYKKADAVLLVYDISQKSSFEKIKKYYVEQIKENCNEDIPVLLLGNKIDKIDERQVSYEEGIDLALKENYEFKESTCLKNKNVAGAFEDLLERWNFQNHKMDKKNMPRKNSGDNIKKKKKKNLDFEKNDEKKGSMSDRNLSFQQNNKNKKGKENIVLSKKKAKSKKKKKFC